MKRTPALALILALGACQATLPTYTNSQALEFCQDRARAATGPTGGAEVGFGSDGPSGEFSLSFGSDFIRGRDPNIVFSECMDRLRANGQIIETASAG